MGSAAEVKELLHCPLRISLRSFERCCGSARQVCVIQERHKGRLMQDGPADHVRMLLAQLQQRHGTTTGTDKQGGPSGEPVDKCSKVLGKDLGRGRSHPWDRTAGTNTTRIVGDDGKPACKLMRQRCETGPPSRRADEEQQWPLTLDTESNRAVWSVEKVHRTRDPITEVRDLPSDHIERTVQLLAPIADATAMSRQQLHSEPGRISHLVVGACELRDIGQWHPRLTEMNQHADQLDVGRRVLATPRTVAPWRRYNPLTFEVPQRVGLQTDPRRDLRDTKQLICLTHASSLAPEPRYRSSDRQPPAASTNSINLSGQRN
jgi:hypothetical protein